MAACVVCALFSTGNAIGLQSSKGEFSLCWCELLCGGGVVEDEERSNKRYTACCNALNKVNQSPLYQPFDCPLVVYLNYEEPAPSGYTMRSIEASCDRTYGTLSTRIRDQVS